MPTIEIISSNSTGLGLSQSDFKVAIIEENELISHRGLFSEVLKRNKGVIVHIGNPDFKEEKESGFFAGDIINWDFIPINEIVAVVDPGEPEYESLINQQFQFQFEEEYKEDILKIMSLAFESSADNTIYFLTDYQFGPVGATSESGYSITEFWQIHDKNGIIFNRIYEINRL